MRSFLVVVFLALTATAAAAAPALVPQPRSMWPVACGNPGHLILDRPLRFPSAVDRGGFELLRERWRALGIPVPVVNDAGATVQLRRFIPSAAVARHGAYAIAVDDRHVELRASSPDAAFYALTTLAQLPERVAGQWTIGCGEIADWPEMRWRVLSDDVSRGPFPTMDYAKRRIRTLASLKYNGWSPYMEHVFADPRYPFVASPNRWTPSQLHELAEYARRFHVTLIPEQQTFAHMHETLKWEQLAPRAELPHGYLMAQSDPATYEYLGPLVKGVVDATKPVPFVHLGSDEPIDLGRGRTPRTAQTFADHVKRVASFLTGSGAQPMIWDDAIQQDRTILPLLPKNLVIVTFHYGVEKTYTPYIRTVADAGFEQMVAPGAANWNEIYPDLQTSYANVARFVGEAKGARGMLGMFMTVWHDDGETLYEATWPTVAYAAAAAWEPGPVDDHAWHRSFARTFFGSDNPRYADALDSLAIIRSGLRTSPSDPPDYLFWRDPFDPRVQERASTLDLAGLRKLSETVLHNLSSAPPLNAEAITAMKLGALRYDQLARRLQIGKEAREYYDDGRAHATKPGVSQVYRSLGVAKYLCWELRNGLADIEPIYAAAWRTESTEPGLQRMLAHYRAGEDDAQRCADRIDGVMREDYLRKGTVPAWDDVMTPSGQRVMSSPH